MDAFMLDGNAVAGLLYEVFDTEMTEATGTCGNCGLSAQVGAVHVFRSAGIVLRCPRCDNVLAKVVQRQTQACVDLSGLSTLA
jgi:ribosomal protein S27AE